MTEGVPDFHDDFGAAMRTESALRSIMANGHAAPSPPRPAKHFPILSLTECKADTRSDYVIKGLLEPGDLGIVFGPPFSGKSVIAPYLAHAVASGREVFGRRVKAGVVVYIASEDGSRMRLRAAALRAVHGNAHGFYLVPMAPDFMSGAPAMPPDLEALQALLKKLKATLVIVDTLAASFPGLQENESSDMGRAVRVLRSLSDPSGAAVLAIHHGSKAGGETPRGHGVLWGAADLVLRVEPPGADGGPALVHTVKNKAGGAGAPLAFSIENHDLGIDDEGDPIQAPVAMEGAAQSAARKATLPPLARMALSYLTDVILTEGIALPHGTGWPDALLRGVPEGRWRDECDSRRLSCAESAGNRDRVFRREVTRLKEAGKVAFRDGLVWLICPDQKA